MGKESWGLLTALLRAGQAAQPQAQIADGPKGQASCGPVQGLLASSNVAWISFRFEMVIFPCFLWKTWPLVSLSLSLYSVSSSSRLLLFSVHSAFYNYHQGCLHKGSVKNLLHMTLTQRATVANSKEYMSSKDRFPALFFARLISHVGPFSGILNVCVCMCVCTCLSCPLCF